MKLKALSTAMILATVPMTGAFAAAMDRSGQSIAAFLQPGNYFEAGISVLDADVSGRSTPLAPGLPSQDTGDLANDYYFPAAALKLQLTDNFSFGLLYDQPFGAHTEYNTPNLNFTDATGGTSAEVTTENLTFLFGFQPNQNWNFYAGPVIQTAEGEVSLRGLAYGGPTAFGSYDATLKKDTELGWIAGLAYQIPEIALKASLTYRSEVEHELQATETVRYGQFNLASNPLFTPGKTSVTTPQSVNLDFQTGVMADTVAFANVRWVNWEDFSIRPNYFGQAADARGLVGANLVDYSDDQISATLGVGRKFNEKWAGNVSVGWDSGAGDPVTTLGPTEGYWNVGLGLQFSPATNYFIAGGVKYFMLGDATAKTAAVNNVGTFEDNDAWGYGLKMGYRF
ncbi:outer membrane protein transport protein [Acinetobacter sp. SCLZS86]|uniref:OmpP1/FadL family transporter n=1 Tax=Acinetobacter sp. SCLZS86 TaxID=2908637 RepID=UPI001F383A37|nr:outer membrane protein transport protein [Acinetobacter sp. SCLZS86]UIZ56910.1 outer membrane protein transport protein [Acinetobacter sp. SCLZS86]